MKIKKYCELYYHVVKVEGGYGWKIYNKYYAKDNRETLEESEEVSETEAMAEGDARDAISYHYI